MASRLQEKYMKEVAPALMEKFGYKNVMEIPKLDKIVINMGIGDARENPKGLEKAVEEMLSKDAKEISEKAKKVMKLNACEEVYNMIKIYLK